MGLTLLIVVIIGGANIWAGILTTVILMGFSEASRGFQDLSTGLYAVLLMVIFFVFPDGLSSVLFSVTSAAKRTGAKYISLRPSRLASPPPPKKGASLAVENISMYYGGTAALSDVSFSVKGDISSASSAPTARAKRPSSMWSTGYLKPATGKVSSRGTDVTRMRAQ